MLTSAYVLLTIVLGLILLVNFRRKAKVNDLQAKASQLRSYEIRFPAYGSQPQSNLLLYKEIYYLLSEYGVNARKPSRVVIEIMSKGKAGIIFLCRVPPDLAQEFKNYLMAYWPQIEIVEAKRSTASVEWSKTPFSLVRRWTFKPEKTNLTGISPTDNAGRGTIETLLANLHGLKSGELAVVQLVVSVPRQVLWTKVVVVLAKAGQVLLRSVKELFLYLLANQRTIADRRKPRSITAANKSGNTGVPLRVCIRSVVAAQQEQRVRAVNLTLSAGLGSFGLTSKIRPGQLADFSLQRNLSPDQVSSDRLESAFGFPLPGNSVRPDIMSSSGAVALPISGSLSRVKRRVEVVLGMNEYNALKTAIGLTQSERQKHLMIIGGTGMGKTTMIEYMIAQDVYAKGRGLALIDPHGDLAESVTGLIPKIRLNDLTYIDPKDFTGNGRQPIGLNLMELPANLDAAQQEIAKDIITESIVSIFRKIFSDDQQQGGHRIEYILRNTIHTAFTSENPTLFTLNKILSDDIYRAGIVAKLTDPSLRNFWYGEFNKAGNYQRVKMIAGVTAKLGRFQRSAVTRKILEQPHSSLDFSQLVNQGKILICNFSKGAIGEDTSSLLGMIVLAKLQLAAWERSLIEIDQRRPFYLYVDEFQNFNSSSISQLISESRKYGFCLTLAEQSTANQAAKDSNILMANTGNIVCFRLAGAVDLERLGPVFAPFVSGHDLSSLKPHQFYIRLSSETTNEPVSGETIFIRNKNSA